MNDKWALVSGALTSNRLSIKALYGSYQADFSTHALPGIMYRVDGRIVIEIVRDGHGRTVRTVRPIERYARAVVAMDDHLRLLQKASFPPLMKKFVELLINATNLLVVSRECPFPAFNRIFLSIDERVLVNGIGPEAIWFPNRAVGFHRERIVWRQEVGKIIPGTAVCLRISTQIAKHLHGRKYIGILRRLPFRELDVETSKYSGSDETLVIGYALGQ